MTEKAQKRIHIKWIRSGIGFTRRQKGMVRSLGLRRLNQVVERPDTPQIRGLVENIPHLVEIVPVPARPAWLSVPEYTIHPPEPFAEAPAPPPKAEHAEAATAAAAEDTEKRAAKESKAEQEKAAETSAKAQKAKKAAKAPAGKAKAAKASDASKTKAAGKSKSAQKTRK